MPSLTRDEAVARAALLSVDAMEVELDLRFETPAASSSPNGLGMVQGAS